MISGWAGTGLNDSAIVMPTPDIRLYYRAGGFPLVKITKNSVSIPTRVVADRQVVVMAEGSDAALDFGWEIYFQRLDAYGAAMVEMSEEDLIPLEIEFCPDTTIARNEEADVVSGATVETSPTAPTFLAEVDSGTLVVYEEP